MIRKLLYFILTLIFITGQDLAFAREAQQGQEKGKGQQKQEQKMKQQQERKRKGKGAPDGKRRRDQDNASKAGKVGNGQMNPADSGKMKGKRRASGDNPGKGKAYGKSKGDMTGREFGQLRSEEARAQLMERQKALAEEIKFAEKAIDERERKLQDARMNLDAKKAEGMITEDEVAKKEEIMKLIQARIDTVKAEVARKKKELEKQEEQE